MQMVSNDKLVVSAQMGCSTSDLVMAPFFKELQKVFQEFLTRSYFYSLADMSIVLRVSGQLADFKGEGPERLQYNKKDRHITIDFVIPETRWRDIDESTIREYVAAGVEQCFDLLVERARKLHEVVDDMALREDFASSMKKFRGL